MRACKLRRPRLRVNEVAGRRRGALRQRACQRVVFRLRRGARIPEAKRGVGGGSSEYMVRREPARSANRVSEKDGVIQTLYFDGYEFQLYPGRLKLRTQRTASCYGEHARRLLVEAAHPMKAWVPLSSRARVRESGQVCRH